MSLATFKRKTLTKLNRGKKTTQAVTGVPATRFGPYPGNNSMGLGLGPRIKHGPQTTKIRKTCSTSALPKVPINQKSWAKVFRGCTSSCNFVGAKNDDSSLYTEKKHVTALCKQTNTQRILCTTNLSKTTNYVNMKDICPVTKTVSGYRSSSEQLYYLKKNKVCYKNDPVLKRPSGC